MARIKCTCDAVEIAARLRQVITRRDPIDPKHLKAKIICISGLAHLYHVDLGPTFFALARTYGYVPSDKDKLGPQQPVQASEPEQDPEEDSLTPSVGSILDEMGDN